MLKPINWYLYVKIRCIHCRYDYKSDFNRNRADIADFTYTLPVFPSRGITNLSAQINRAVPAWVGLLQHGPGGVTEMCGYVPHALNSVRLTQYR
jgi:hypothetical protein